MKTVVTSDIPAMLRSAKRADDFGAVGNGAGDAAAALQAALDAVGRGGALFIPPGKYRISSGLRLVMSTSAPTTISAYGATLNLIGKGDVPALHILSERASVPQLVIEGLEIEQAGKARARTAHGILVEAHDRDGRIEQLLLKDLALDRCGGDGCHIVGHIGETQILNCYFSQNRNGLTLRTSTTAGVPASVHVFGSSFTDNAESGVQAMGAGRLAAPDDLGFSGCYFADNGRYGVHLPAGCAYLTNCVIENNWASATAARGECRAGAFVSGHGSFIGCTGNGKRLQSHLVEGDLRGTLTMVGCSVAGPGAKLFSLRGAPEARVRIIGCRGLREYSGLMPGQASEIANLP